MKLRKHREDDISGAEKDGTEHLEVIFAKRRRGKLLLPTPERGKENVMSPLLFIASPLPFRQSPPSPDDASARNIVDVDVTNRDNIDKAEPTAVYRIKWRTEKRGPFLGNSRQLCDDRRRIRARKEPVMDPSARSVLMPWLYYISRKVV